MGHRYFGAGLEAREACATIAWALSHFIRAMVRG